MPKKHIDFFKKITTNVTDVFLCLLIVDVSFIYKDKDIKNVFELQGFEETTKTTTDVVCSWLFRQLLNHH